MKNKSTLILGVVFVVLAVLYFFVSYNPPEVTRGAMPLFEGEKPDIDRIEIVQQHGMTILLERENGAWQMREPFEFKAYDRFVNNLVTQIQDAVVDGIVSSRQEARADFAVGDSTGIGLTVSSGGTVVFDGIIGRQASDVGHCYARRRDSDDIELWRGMLSQEVRRDVNEWRDRVVYSINQDDIIAAEAVEDGTTRSLEFDESVWQYHENGGSRAVDTTRVRTLIGFIANLSADDFAGETDIQNLIGRDYDVEVTLRVRNGDTHTYHLWRPTGDYTRYLLRKAGGDLLYRFYEYGGARLALDYEQMQPLDS